MQLIEICPSIGDFELLKNEYLKRTGGTMNGPITMLDNTVFGKRTVMSDGSDGTGSYTYRRSTNPATSKWMDAVVGTDSDGAGRFNLRQTAHADGYQGVQLEAHSVINNTNYYNGIRMEVGADGALRVVVTSPAAWRAAIAALAAQNANGYWGMGTPAGSFSDWIRTTSSGIIPYSSNTNGASSLGTSSWPFANLYVKNVNGKAYSFSNKSATLAWNTNVTLANVCGVDITAKLPANPNTDHTYALSHTTKSFSSEKKSVNSGKTFSISATEGAIPSGYQWMGGYEATTAHNQAAYIGGFRCNSTGGWVSGKNTSGSDWTDMTITVYSVYAKI